MAALRAAEISSALTAWDAATESWGAARDEGTRHLAAVANTAMAITHVQEGGAGAAFGAACLGAAHAKLYTQLVRQHQDLGRSLEALRAAVRDMGTVAAQLDPSSEPMQVVKSNRRPAGDGGSSSGSGNGAGGLLLTHDEGSLSAVLAELVGMYQAQLVVNEDVARTTDPSLVLGYTTAALSLRTSLWLMEVRVSPGLLAKLDRIRRTELDARVRAHMLK